MLVAIGESAVICSAVIALVDGIKCRALLELNAGVHMLHPHQLRICVKKRPYIEQKVIEVMASPILILLLPFLLAATLKQHLQALQEKYPQKVEAIKKCIYVDCIISTRCLTAEVLNLKPVTILVFEETNFELHKLHSNDPQQEGREVKNEPAGDDPASYAEQQLAVQVVKQSL